MPRYRARRPRVIDEAADVTDAQMRAAARATSFRGLLGQSLPDQMAELVDEAKRAETRVRHAAVLAKLARDFGPETAKLAEQLAEREITNRLRPTERAMRKLDAAGRYGFR